MAKTYSFDEIFAPSETTQTATPAVSSPKFFSFDDVMKMQPVEEPAAPVTTPAPVTTLAPAAAPVTQPVVQEEPVAGQPPKTTSGFDVAAMPEQFKSGLTGLQQGWYANVGRNNAQILNVMDAIDRGDYIVPEKDVIGYQEMTPEQRAMYKEGFLKTLGTNIQDYQQYKKEQATYARNATSDEMIRLADEKDYKGAWNAFKSDPLGVLQQLSVESLPNVLPSLAGGVAGLALKGGMAGIAVGLGTGSFPIEFMGSIAESLSESGVNLDDPKAIAEKIRDPKFIEEAGKKAVTRGQTIAFTDALSAGVISPLKAGQIFKNILIATGNVAKEVALEGTGELLAQTASGEEIKPGQVLAEMLGAGPQAVATTGFKTIAESRKPAETGTAKVEPPLGTTAEETTAEPTPPSTQYDYLDTPEYQDVNQRIDEASKQSEALQANIDSFAEGTPERSEAIRQYIDFFDNTLNPLFEERKNLKPTEEVTEPSATEVTEPAKTSDQDIIWMDQQAMNDELAQIEGEANKPARVEPTFTEAEPVAATVEEPAETVVEPVAETTEELQPGDTVTLAEAITPKETVAKETPVEEVVSEELPPELFPPGDFKLKKGRNEQVALAARELAAGNITKEEYDRYVDTYTSISTIANPEAPLNQDLMADILTTKLGKNNKKPELVNAPVADGTRVGLRMDIPALDWGKANGQNGSVVSVHEGADPNRKTQGKNISYTATGVVDNPVFAVRSEERAFGIAQNLEGKEGQKTPQQTIEGNWVNMDPAEVYRQIQENLNNPEWTQVSLDPLRHSFFYDRATRQPVLSADRVLQVGRFVLAKNVKYGERENFLYSLNRNRNGAYEGGERQRRPSLRRATTKLIDELRADDVNPTEVADKLDAALRRSGEPQEVQPRVRGADFIRQRLLEAKRRGELTEAGVDMAEWFIQQNPMLVDELGISIRQPREEGGAVGGTYNPLVSIITLMKDASNDDTVVHEILHHAERMMPRNVQEAIRKTWMRSMSNAAMKAFRGTDQNLVKYFVNLFEGHVHGDEKALREANRQLVQGEVSVADNYQYFNPSEFWAVNGSDIVANRYDSMRSVLTRLKNWLKEFAQKAKSLFGMESNAALIRALNSLARADGQFVSQSMLSSNSTSFASIVKNYKGQPAPGASFTAPEKTRLTEAAYNLVNEQTYLKRVTEVLEKAYQVPANLNAYTKELLKNSRAAYRSKMFHLQEVRPILQLMQKYKIADDQLTEYAQAKFAEQRNKQIAARGGLADGGSGMYTAQAQAILAAIPPAREAQLEQVRQMIKNIITGTQNLYVASGAETQDTINAWNDIKNSEYVPLNRKDEDFAMGSSGLGGIGYSASGRSTRMATGSIDKDVKSILENVIHQRDVANERAERIRVGNPLYAMTIKYPNPKFWLPINPDAIKNKTAAIAELQSFGLSPTDIDHFMSQPKVARIDPKTGKLEYAADASALKADNVFATKINGKNRYVVFNKNDPTAMAVVTALKSLPVEQAGAVLGTVGKATRLWSAITTQFNPIWGLFVNMPRDILWMYSTLSSTPIMGNKWEMTKKLLPAMIGSWEALRAERSGKPVTGHWAQTFQTASMDGARTMFRDSWVNAREDGEYLKNEMAKLNRGNVNKVVRGFVNVLEDFNNMLESSIRLAAYDTAIQQGLSKDEAARISKEITVNFDRRGAKTNYARNLYAFFNAAVQGSAKLYEVMKSPAGNKIMATMAGMGILQAAMLSMAGLGDDDVPDYEKEKNFIIPTGGKGYIKIPMMQGLSIFVNVGRLAWEMPMDVMNNKGRNMGKKVSSLLSSVGNAFNPFGESSNVFLGMAPTLARPAASVSINEDAFGRKIHKEAPPGKPSPGYLRSKENASPLGQGIAQLINKISGGSEFVQGKFSPTGDDIDYLAKQYAGGLGREITGAIKFGSAINKGEPLEVNQIPIISKYFGTSDRRGAVARNFYDNVNDIAKYYFEYKSYADTDRDAKADSVMRKYPEAELHTEAQSLVRSISKISKMHEQRAKENAPKSELRALENEQFLMMREFNAEVAKMKRRR